VQDILDKVPEAEETVLVDGDGRWYTPNKKYTSSSAGEAGSLSKDIPEREREGDVKKEDVQSKVLLSSESTLPDTPALPKASKPVIEVYEIESDDEEGQSSPVNTGNEAVQPLSFSRGQSFQGVSPAAMSHPNGSSNGHAFVTQPTHASDSTLQPLTPPLPAPRTGPERPRNVVIDLTLSDSEEEEPMRYRPTPVTDGALGRKCWRESPSKCQQRCFV
jgi:hypothetical protein